MSTVNLRFAVPKRIKKDRTIKLARSVLELLTGIVRNKTITTLNNNINFVSFCDGIAIVRTLKLGFSRKQKSAIASPLTRRIIKSFLQTKIRRVNGESPVSSSKSDIESKQKKDQAENLFFRFNSVRFGAANRN